MKRITPEQAKLYVPCDEDLTNSEKSFFTLTQDPTDEKWEIITYYTARKENIYENRDGEGDSWVYILKNASMPNLIKIGYTKKEPDIRAKQVSRGTGVPTNFSVEFAFKCFNAESLEREIHKYLKPFRVNNNKEFFQISIEEAESTIELLGQRYL
jgi:hypothetical protein